MSDETTRMARKDFKALGICEPCRHFHRYQWRVKSHASFCDKDMPKDQVEVYNVDTYSRCLVGVGIQPKLDLDGGVIVGCNRFKRKETKKKL